MMNYQNITISRVLAMLAVFGLAMLWNGCKKETAPVAATLMVAHDLLEVPGGASEQYVDFLTGSSWELTADVDWIRFEQSAGDKGKHKIKFMVDPNEDDERGGFIQVSNQDGMTAEIQVFQHAGLVHVFYVKPDGQGDGRSWESAMDLQNALEAATSGSTLHVAAGTYRPTATVTNGDEADDGDKTFEIRFNLALIGGYPSDAQEGSISNPSVHKTILSGRQENNSESYHVVTVTAPVEEGHLVEISGVTITEGHGSDRGTQIAIQGNNFSRGNGAGMAIGQAIVELDEVEVIGNRTSAERGAAGQAAGVFVFAGAEVTIKNSKINDNHSVSNGGGLWVDRAKAFVFDSEINGNGGGTAAGVHAYPDATLHMYNSTVAHNQGRSYGAGVYLRQNSKGVLVNTLISDNTSTSPNGGGGVMLYDDCEVDIISTTIVNNNIQGPGGGVYRRSGSNRVRIFNSIISGNQQAEGSTDVDVFEANAAPAEIRGSAISDKVYGAAGSEVGDASFSFSSMLSASYRLQGTDNPATAYGMDANSLTGLINQFVPPLDAELITADKEGNSRQGKTTMGALTE